MPIPEDLLALINEVQAAAFLGLTRRALQNFRLAGGGPRYVRISIRCIRYRKKDLIEWSNEKIRTSTSELEASSC
ncbi:MAG: DNA-binding protein [Nitrospina sp.]|nr:DNA-binding protein [Nitrospina sp.]MBT3921802.1 DNA-binding protein [Nitrospina sp.]MBT6716329.1 DNA-binding protein [Nitrospina sp.]